MDIPGAKPTLMYRLYCIATAVLAPFAWWLVRRKLTRADVPLVRQWERLGHASAPRPQTRLIWLHGASVGESLSALTLIDGLSKRLPHAAFLVTSGTPTSAALVDQRRSARTLHQYATLDALGPVTRFLDHWSPDAAIFVESELWPLTLTETSARAVPLALVNARLSDRSVAGWCKYPATAAFVLGHFSALIAQNAKAADDLRRMGAPSGRVMVGGNLKAFAPVAPIDPRALQNLQAHLSGRPVWVAASTHPGEEEPVLKAHVRLLDRHPDLCLILIPRHPERGDSVAALVKDAGLSVTRRSTQDAPTGQVYLADTLGELPLWYALAPFAFLGGSLTRTGGHNPFEPAQAGAAILTGPHVTNFAESFAPLLDIGAAVQVSDAQTLTRAAARWLSDPGALDAARRASQTFATRTGSDFDAMIDRLCNDLDLR